MAQTVHPVRGKWRSKVMRTNRGKMDSSSFDPSCDPSDGGSALRRRTTAGKCEGQQTSVGCTAQALGWYCLCYTRCSERHGISPARVSGLTRTANVYVNNGRTSAVCSRQEFRTRTARAPLTPKRWRMLNLSELSENVLLLSPVKRAHSGVGKEMC